MATTTSPAATTATTTTDPANSLSVWAASKIIGRECASVNYDFMLCKKEKGEEPEVCMDHGLKVIDCTNNIVANISEKFPRQMAALKTCLNENDYRFGDCKKEEKIFLDAWNKHNK